MILVDTSVWIAHFRGEELFLQDFLRKNQVLCHEFIVGELACGNLPQRKQTLSDLQKLPTAQNASSAEVLFLLEKNALVGAGLGWIDAHLLASAKLVGARLWSKDKRLIISAHKLDCGILM